MKPINIDEFLKIKQLNDIIDPENLVTDNQSEYFSANSEQIDKDSSVNDEDNNEDTIFDREEQDEYKVSILQRKFQMQMCVLVSILWRKLNIQVMFMIKKNTQVSIQM